MILFRYRADDEWTSWFLLERVTFHRDGIWINGQRYEAKNIEFRLEEVA